MKKTNNIRCEFLIPDFEAIVPSKVVETGNGAMARISKKYLGKEVKIIVIRRRSKNEIDKQKRRKMDKRK